MKRSLTMLVVAAFALASVGALADSKKATSPAQPATAVTAPSGNTDTAAKQDTQQAATQKVAKSGGKKKKKK